jgi:hypothetical protein
MALRKLQALLSFAHQLHCLSLSDLNSELGS